MSRERHAQLAELFEAVVALDADARAAELARLPEETRLQLTALLAADALTRDPMAAAIDSASAATAPRANTHIGGWRVLRELGAGGMGTVLLAERADDSFRQQVAIKLIRGFPTADGQRRLRLERQILADLDHPNIARLLDGGETADGQPYVVMEYVEGLPLLDHVARAGLALDQRLELFDNIAAAVQHAHQRLVIHRDIKPGNVLVRADGEPRLLDFGVAKLVDVSASEDARQTSTRVWTPGYASPEQQSGDTITTATDVFGLGVLLRELLSGERSPGQHGQLPSGFQPLSLDAELRGLLDMAIALDPSDRYPTVEALRDDIARYRSGRPLRARADRLGYRMRKFLLRHRLGVAVAVLALTVAAGFTWQLAAERDRALLAEAEARAARMQSDRAAASARAALGFLTDTLAAVAPEAALSSEVSVRDLLDQARRQLELRMGEEATAVQAIQRLLGQLYYAISEPVLAEPLLAAGLAGVEPTLPEEAFELAQAHAGHSAVLGVLERGADSLAAAQAVADLHARFAPNDPAKRVESLEALAHARYRLGELEAADALWSEALALAQSLPTPPVDSMLNIIQAWGSVLEQRGRWERALELADQGWALAEAHLPKDSPTRVNLLRLRAEALLRRGSVAAAETAARDAIALQRRTGGERGQRLGTLYNTLAMVFNDQGRYREAIEAAETSARLQADSGSGAVEDAIGLTNTAAIHENAGDYWRALELFEAARARIQRGEADPDDLPPRMIERSWARCLALAGEAARASEILADLQRRSLALDGESSFEYAMVTWQLTLAARRAGELEPARQQLQHARRLFSALLPETHPLFAHMLRAEAHLERAAGRTAIAEPLQREAVERLRAAEVLAVDLAIARAELAALWAQLGRRGDARRELAEALPALRASLLPTEPSRAAGEQLAAQLGIAASAAREQTLPGTPRLP
ncbi:MAG: serine/threonine-protein kinase [Aquimonas sp.]|nr:serine/threonine-protein kinase [Aquimonas sp.]